MAAALPTYTLGAELGSGGHGLVLAGHHQGLGRDVAIKILPATADPDLPTTFATEARLLAGLDHPHIVRIYDYVERDGLCLLIMELLAGGTLARRRRTLSAEDACAVGLAIAEALECAHARSVLHRDIKPDNVLFSGNGLLKVTDFSIAKIFDATTVATNTIVGTPRYMAPEQLGGGRLSPATDLYALGIILYEMLAGAPPFGPDLSLLALIRQKADRPTPPPAGVPEPVAATLMRALERDPALRHPSARAFALDLARAAALAYGPRWTSRCEIGLHVADDVREAARYPAGAGGASGLASNRAAAAPPGQSTPPGRPTPPRPPAGPPASGRLPAPVAAPVGIGRDINRQVARDLDVGRQAGRGEEIGRQADWDADVTARRVLEPVPAAPPPAVMDGTRRRRRRRRIVAVAAAVPVVASVVAVLLTSQPPRPATIITVAGTGVAGFSGDNGPATAADLSKPDDPLVDNTGAVYFTDTGNNRIRRIGADGIITTVAGTGTYGFSGDNGPAAQAHFATPTDVARDRAGNLYIADTDNNRIRRINVVGTVTTVAGTGTPGYSGDGGPATAAQLAKPTSVLVDADGTLYIADTGNHRIRRIGTNDVITTVAGSGTSGYSGDGGPATAAQLARPGGLAADTAGNLYIADNANNRIRRVSSDGVIITVAGSGTSGYSGDGGPATAAQLANPGSVAVTDDGRVYIADTDNNRVRRVDADGVITTVAGSDEAGYSGDGGPATAARLCEPNGLGLDTTERLLYITDNCNDRIRRVMATG
ncbi:protein kinase domain-containing protein [Protofrankia symbiont of Coriaria myrtifolia]|uniref:protein kinase domain-containing protein n=1 Tax=Protofrankia symbiont of Coriaria myrtifolia TaxID=1306540 RepID=UPI0002F6A600|nr:protein kinase [Protofrankia symbiont of Coriaria myrtifolia]